MRRLYALGVALALASIVFVQLAMMTQAPKVIGFGDFGSFYAAGDAANHGANPYGDYSLAGGGYRYGQPVLETNLNPPVSVLLMQPLALLDIATAQTVFRVISALAYILICLALLRWFGSNSPVLRLGAMLLLDAFWSTIYQG